VEELREITAAAGTEFSPADQRPVPEKLTLKFLGSLTPEQMNAVQPVLSNDMGVLVAPPGAGKTVMGCYAVAERNVPTLILAHRKPILDQWRIQLGDLLGLSPHLIGQVGGGRNRQTGVIDLGMMQSLLKTWKLFSRNTALSSWTSATTCLPLHSKLVLEKRLSVTSWVSPQRLTVVTVCRRLLPCSVGQSVTQ
jgi:superfamily II DNA or RNA helicase